MGRLLVTLTYREVESAGEVEDIESRLQATSPDTLDSEFVEDDEHCTCRRPYPEVEGLVHRTDGPCYYEEISDGA